MKTNIYLPVEVKRREIYSRIYFAYKAALKGYNVTIGRKSRFYEFKKYLTPGYFLSKSLGKKASEELIKIKNLGHKILYIDEEGLMSFNKEFTHRRISTLGLDVLDVFFTWGKQHFDEMKLLFPNHEDKFRIAGNPRVDILKEEKKNIFKDEVSYIKKKYGNFFLLATKFGKVNFLKRRNLNDQVTAQKKKGYLRSDNMTKILSRSILHEKKNFENFLEFIKAFNSKLPEKKMIILIHPSENREIYQKFISNMKNIFLAENNFSSNSWILASELTIQNNSTTSLETYILKNQSIQLNVYSDATVEYEIPKKISKIFYSNDDLIKFLKVFKKDEYFFDKKNIDRWLKKFIENIDEEDSVSLILNNLRNFNDFNFSISKLDFFLKKKFFFLKQIKRNFINRLIKKNETIHSKLKFDGLRLNEIRKYINNLSIGSAQNEKIVITEPLPGLFEIKVNNLLND